MSLLHKLLHDDLIDFFVGGGQGGDEVVQEGAGCLGEQQGQGEKEEEEWYSGGHLVGLINDYN